MGAVQFLLVSLFVVEVAVDARSILRSAPQMCPIEDGNLLEVKLFVRDGNSCYDACERNPECQFFRFYDKRGSQPSQCFLFKSCGRKVENATFDCVLNRENTIEVKAFTKTEEECEAFCQEDRKCGYYKHFLTDDERNQFCYLLKSCSKRMIDNIKCALGRNNILEMRMFVTDLEECAEHCREVEGCRYYWWNPIEYSEAPRYCFLYQQCAPSDKEPEVAMLMGGRHPGHYFMTKNEHNDLVMRNDVCMVGVNDEFKNVSLARAGATAEYVQGGVLFCGGKSLEGVHAGCLMYDPARDKWIKFTKMIKARDEASSATAANLSYVIGGIGEKTVEFVDLNDFDLEPDEDVPRSREEEFNVPKPMPKWKLGPSLPEIRSRGCGAASPEGDKIYVIGGHDNSSTASLSSGHELDVANNKWKDLPPMIEPRRDHACLFIELEETSGILVTGGLGENGQVLHTTEFYDVKEKKWTKTSSMKIARTEHAMSLIYGIPTVIGGLSGTEFLSSIEQFDKSSASWNVPLQRDWRIINHVLNSPRYEMAVASIPISRITVCDADIV